MNMQLINRKNFFPSVCCTYTILSLLKIATEAFTQGKWEIDQQNFVMIFCISLVATFVLSQYYRFQRFPPLAVILGQYLVILGGIMFTIWVIGHFTELSEYAYRDMFRSFTIPYVIIAGWYYISLFQEIKKANEMLEEIRKEKKDGDNYEDYDR